VLVRVSGALAFAPAANDRVTNTRFTTRVAESQAKWVTVNSSRGVDFITPSKGNSGGGIGIGYWSATATFWFTVNGKMSNVASKTMMKWANLTK